MTEVTFDKKTFLATLDALQTQFKLMTPTIQLQTELGGTRFQLHAKRMSDHPDRDDMQPVSAFGPCQVKGEPVSVEFDIKDLHAAILDAHQSHEAEKVTLLVGEGVWVKDPAPAA